MDANAHQVAVEDEVEDVTKASVQDPQEVQFYRSELAKDASLDSAKDVSTSIEASQK